MIFKETYNECITNLACSIMRYFELEYQHNTIEELDNILDSNIKNVVVVLCDGLGNKILNNTLPKDSFLIKNRLKVINSVHPSTTTAATTSMLSGMNPAEHGWLGWDLYFKEIDKVVTMFLNTIKDTNTQVNKESVAKKYFAYKNITEQILEEGKYHSKILFPFGPNSYYGFDDMLVKIKKEFNIKEKNYIYAYYENPDGLLHEYGVDSEQSIKNINFINDSLEKFSETLNNDTLLIITADHGHINCDPIVLSNYPEIFNLLDKDISIEGRFCSFFIKKEKCNEFRNLFNEYFKDSFILKSKVEVIKEKLFGTGKEHKKFKESLGDFLAIATGKKYFCYNENSVILKSMHAGITEDEMKVPLIIIKK